MKSYIPDNIMLIPMGDDVLKEIKQARIGVELWRYFLFIIITYSCITDKTKEGDLYYKNNKYIEAITSYDESLKLDPNNVKSIYRRGRSYEELGIYNKALEDYLKVIEIDKTFKE